MKIEITKLDKDRLDCMRFVIRAKAKESTRYALAFVKIEPGRFVATDGKRLHIADIAHSYDPGMYEVISNRVTGVVLLTADDPGNFPKYEDILPDHKAYFECLGNKIPASAAIAFGLAKKDIMVNLDYLSAAADGEGWKVYFGEPDRPVLLVGKNKNVVLVPVNAGDVTYKTEGVELASSAII